MKFVALAACDPQGVIGNEGTLPWHYPEELAHFRASTWGHVMLMGYSTYLSMPERAFKGRISIVFTRKRQVRKCENIFQVSGLEELEHLFEKNPLLREKTHWVIGGAEIFHLFFSRGLIQSAVMTYLKKSYEGDTFFPLHYLKNWSQEVVRETADFLIVRHTVL
jgi:dihydrofolate reductase